MVREGYAAVTYRAVAAKAGVTSGLVQYYFPTLDDLFIAAIRRRSEQNLQRLAAALEARPDEPLRVLWEYSQEESTAALTTEFLALGNHRKSIASEIAEVTEQVRRAPGRRPSPATSQPAASTSKASRPTPCCSSSPASRSSSASRRGSASPPPTTRSSTISKLSSTRWSRRDLRVLGPNLSHRVAGPSELRMSAACECAARVASQAAIHRSV